MVVIFKAFSSTFDFQGKRYSKARKNVTPGIKEIPHVIMFKTSNEFITSGSCV